MSKLNLTNPDDILEFGFNYFEFKNTIPLPPSVTLEIEKCIYYYNIGFITNNKLGKQITDIILGFINDLDVKITRK